MAKQTMVAADVLQGRRALRLEVLRPTELVPIDDRLLSLLEVIERELGDIRERIISFDSRLERLQSSFATKLKDEAPQEDEFLVHVWSPGGYELESKSGAIPEPGDAFADAGEAIVLSVGRSPLHGDPRPCVFALSL